MSLRRSLVTVAIVGAFVASILAGQHTQAATVTSFGVAPFASRPYASHRTPITTTWYCPGVPAADATVGGEVVVANPTDASINGHVTFVGTDDVAPIVQAIVAPARNKLTIEVAKVMKGTFVSTIVELDGGEGLVEQRALFPSGNAVASCTTQTSRSWYFADGWTVDGSTDQLIITNPYEDTVSVDVAFFTKDGHKREPGAFQGDSINPQSVKVIDVAANGFADEAVIGVQVVASRGRVVVARAQHYQGGGRLGYSVNLGAPTPAEQVWFVDGEHGADVVEQYVIFNPTDEDASVDITVVGLAAGTPFVPPQNIPIPSGQVVTFDTATFVGLPDGPHSLVIATEAKPSVVVERVLTRTNAKGPATTVVLGITPEYLVSRWYLPIGVDEAADDGVVVYNPYQVDLTVALKAVGPGGEVAVPGLEAVPLPAGGIVTVPLTDPSIFAKVLVVEASGVVFVERRLPRGNDLTGRSGSWALPECGPCSISSPPSS